MWKKNDDVWIFLKFSTKGSQARNIGDEIKVKANWGPENIVVL